MTSFHISNENIPKSDIGVPNGPASIDFIYPVGSIYITTSTANPSTIWRNTNWEKFGMGKTLIGIDSTDVDFNTIGATGGAKTVTLTLDEIPEHDHGYSQFNYEDPQILVDSGSTGYYNAYSFEPRTTDPAGGGQAHENMPPYIVTHMWKRLPDSN